MRVLVTGHLGFIGSHFVKYLLGTESHVEIIGFSRCSDTNNLRRLSGGYDWSRMRTVWGDLADPNAVSGLCEGIDVVVNFAAKTFVDHALKDRKPFIESNIIGADNLMEDATRYGVKRFVQVSTDEVYGQILDGAYKEDALLQPRNPYSWSKACADLCAIQRHRTYGFPVIITRTENNFGPWQHRQKALPTFVRCAINNELLPVYGDGMHVRCWLYVEEHCRAIWHLVNLKLPHEIKVKEELDDKGRVIGRSTWSVPTDQPIPVLGEVFHIAGEQEMTNLDLARLVLQTIKSGYNPLPKDQLNKMIKFIPDHNIRPGHDRRYALNCDKLRSTGFKIDQHLQECLAETIRWYRDHPEWTR